MANDSRPRRPGQPGTDSPDPTGDAGVVQAGEPRWPMALAVVVAGVLRATLPPELRFHDARWMFLVVVLVLLMALIIGDPGRIDRDKPWLRWLTTGLIGVITLVNAAAAVRLVVAEGGVGEVQTFTLILRDGRWVCAAFHNTAMSEWEAAE